MEECESVINPCKEYSMNRKDNESLKKMIEEKLVWALEEKRKGLETITRQMQQLDDNRKTMIRLDGMITILEDLLKIKSEEDKKE